MPEYPDITIYIERLRFFVKDRRLQRVRLASPFFLRTFDPPIDSIHGLKVRELERIGKRIVFALENDCYLALHLMISGRLHWREVGMKIPAKRGLAAMDFANGALLITEASGKKRASLHLVKGRERLKAFDRGGIDVLKTTLEQFHDAIKAENHTLKRALTDPRILDGIGNAYSDEILHHAGLSPTQQTKNLNDGEMEKLYTAIREILTGFTRRMRQEVGQGFPEKVTAFRDDMAVHGRYGKPCPRCGTIIQRIRYADNETNYCPRCQTGGKLLADRSLSRLLKKDWPRTPEDLEEMRGG